MKKRRAAVYVPKGVSADKLNGVAQAIANSKRPLIIAGGGCIRAGRVRKPARICQKDPGARVLDADGAGQLIPPRTNSF